MIFYLIGIKGTGMSALAKLLIDDGHIVKGCDSNKYFFTEKNLHITIDSFEDIKLNKNYFYIIGNNYINYKSKLIAYKFLYYPEFIRWYFKNHYVIAFSGTHGKTTSSKMLAYMLKDCSYIIGDGSGRGRGKILVLEACEYRNTFLNYKPNLAIILNVDYDHPDFFKNNKEYNMAFNNFAKHSEKVIINGDDYNCKMINKGKYITYGMNKDNDIIFNYRVLDNKSIVNIGGKDFYLNLFGLHYAYDFVGAYLAAKLVGVSDEYIKRIMNKFVLPIRRMEEYKINDVILIHDYAHHPSEIKCLYNSVSLKYPNKKKIIIFQPHTISRTSSLLDSFKNSLMLYDNIYLLPIFTSSREVSDIKKENELYEYLGFNKINFNDVLKLQLNSDTVYLFVGAGDIYDLFIKLKNINNF